MKIGIDSFVAAVPDALKAENLGSADRLKLLLDEIEFADRVGLDVFGVGEHHRAEFNSSMAERDPTLTVDKNDIFCGYVRGGRRKPKKSKKRKRACRFRCLSFDA